jgi:hypothetical protein
VSDDQTAPRYHAYLLRLWQERPASFERPAVWRFSLEDTRTRQRRGFGSLEALMSFLRAQVEGTDGPDGPIQSEREVRRET